MLTSMDDWKDQVQSEGFVFVFGSNEAGRHGAGSALEALNHYGAVPNVFFGLRGRSFAIPTKDKNLQRLPITQIATYIGMFVQFAATRKDLEFRVVDIGCGLAGLEPRAIAPMFKYRTTNVKFLGELANLVEIPFDIFNVYTSRILKA